MNGAMASANPHAAMHPAIRSRIPGALEVSVEYNLPKKFSRQQNTLDHGLSIESD
jgi:hypothetical protein